MKATILQGIFNHSKTRPSKVALISDGEKVTYADLIDRISRASSFLSDKGVQKGDNVLLSAHKGLDFISLYFAVHLLGAVSVVVDEEFRPQKIEDIRTKTSPLLEIGNFGSALILYDQSCWLVNPGLEKLLKLQEPSDICDILFTTGTTGAPKGVCLSHQNELCAALNINEFIQNSENDIELLALPLCHSFGLGRLRCALFKGATVVLLDGFANLKTIFSAMERYIITGFGMVPSVWSYIKKFSGKRIGKFAYQIKYIEIGSAPLPIEDKELLMTIFPNTRICMHYGLTEASRSTFIEFHESKKYLDSIGKASPNIDIKVMDENGDEVSCGMEGELCVAGRHVMKTYLDPDNNANSRFGNYFRTGDWGYQDEFGFFYLAGRKQEMINVGGKKLSPIEVEDEVIKLPGIKDCVCVGIPDPNGILGEVVKCYLVKEKNADQLALTEIKKLLNGKIETYKIPAKLEYIDKIPTTGSGKKQRKL